MADPFDPFVAGTDLSLLPAGKALCRAGLLPAGEDEADGGRGADERTESAIDRGEGDERRGEEIEE